MTDLTRSPLGHATIYGDRYDPTLLYPVERAPLRAELGLAGTLPFFGEDVWTAYELSWLDLDGKPQIAIATWRIPTDSVAIPESKSVKLYLTALNQTPFASASAVQATLARDLAQVTTSMVRVELTTPDAFANLYRAEGDGECLDTLPLTLTAADELPIPAVLQADGAIVDEALFSRLFRSVCPVTGQPDYASVQITYRGPRIDRAGLLRYLVSYRRHPGFHEHCVERIFLDIQRRCRPLSLQVHARFTRRGSVDINPYRSSQPMKPRVNARTARQ